MPAAKVSLRLLTVIVLTLTEINDAGRITSNTIASINFIKNSGLLAKWYEASAYDTAAAAKLNVVMSVKSLVFCEESLGTNVAKTDTTVANCAMQIAIAT